MSIHPFGDDETSILVLVKDQEQHDLGPDFAGMSVGRRLVDGETDRAVALDYIEHTWTDMRPKRLGEGLAAGGFYGKTARIGVRIWGWLTGRFR